MGRHRLAKPRRRWPVPLGALVVAGVAASLASGASAHPRPEAAPVCCPELVAGFTDLSAAPAASRYKVVASTETSFAISTLAADRSFRGRLLPVGVAPERGLQVETILVARAVSAAFPEIHNIGGVRPDALKWHPNGMAIDVMIPNYQTPAGRELGNRIAAFALQNAAKFHLNHVIWQRMLYQGSGPPKLMPNMGSDDANHYTHVHIATDGGGYPTGLESYFG
ncbi:MAG: hypothetical protein KDB72_10010 [Mycobacterium sp.]|nr:hypothetical protein [Mycobacterium sp.]